MTSRKTAILICTIVLCVLTLHGQAGKQLYLVTGLVANDTLPVDVPASLITVDEVKHAAETVLDLGEGIRLLQVDHDRRLIVVGTDPGLVVINMDLPTMPGKIATTSGFQFLCTPPTGIILQGCSTNVLPDRRLFGLDLSGVRAGEERELPFSDLRNARTEGNWSPIDLSNNHIFLFYKSNRLLFFRDDDASDFGISLPLPAQSFVNARNINIVVSNDNMVVLDCYRQRSPQAEIHELQIYDRKLGAWHSVNLNAGPSIRGFGPWIATGAYTRKRPINVAINKVDLKSELESPGSEFRSRILNPMARKQEQVPLDKLFQDVPWQFTGELDLYNIRTKRQYKIRTGQGDSEVLLVTDSAVYYRVNDALFKSSLGQEPELKGTKIISRPDVQLAHWAFLGP
jgi:hypothetical protein